jgi:hypothetical protein
VTRTPLLKKGNRETRLLTVSQARANISGGRGKNCVSDICMLFLIGYHASRIKNHLALISSLVSNMIRQRSGGMIFLHLEMGNKKFVNHRPGEKSGEKEKSV